MPEQVIDIPGVGPTAFPDSMSSDQINAAAARLYANANPDKKQPPARTWTDMAIDYIPVITGTAGAVIGGIGGTVAGVGVGGVPGAAGGAAVGTAGGEALKQLINRARGASAPATMTQAATDIAMPALEAGATTAALGTAGQLLRPAAGTILQKVGGAMESPSTLRQMAGRAVTAAGRAVDAADAAPKPKMALTAQDVTRIRELMKAGMSQGDATAKVWNFKVQNIVGGWKP
jgi:hypothetical protein